MNAAQSPAPVTDSVNRTSPRPRPSAVSYVMNACAQVRSGETTATTVSGSFFLVTCRFAISGTPNLMRCPSISDVRSELKSLPSMFCRDRQESVERGEGTRTSMSRHHPFSRKRETIALGSFAERDACIFASHSSAICTAAAEVDTAAGQRLPIGEKRETYLFRREEEEERGKEENNSLPAFSAPGKTWNDKFLESAAV